MSPCRGTEHDGRGAQPANNKKLRARTAKNEREFAARASPAMRLRRHPSTKTGQPYNDSPLRNSHTKKNSITIRQHALVEETQNCTSRRTHNRFEFEQAFSTVFAVPTICGAVKPNSDRRSFSGAEAPKVSMPTCAPSKPINRCQPMLPAASMDTRARQASGRTLSLYSGD